HRTGKREETSRETTRWPSAMTKPSPDLSDLFKSRISSRRGSCGSAINMPPILWHALIQVLANQAKQWLHGEKYQEQHCNEPKDPVHRLGLGSQSRQDGVGKKADTDASGNRVGKGHDDNGQKGWDGNFHLVPLDGGQLACHHDDDHNQHW